MAEMNVAVAGGGVAGLEAVMALRSLAGDRLSITLIDPADDFVYQAQSVREPFAGRSAERHSLDAIAREFSVDRVRDRLARIRPEEHVVVTSDGTELSYDALLVAVGARRKPAFRHAVTFRGQDDAEAVHGLIQDVEGGYSRRIAFVVPGGVTWPLPLYELALMTAARGHEMSADVDVVFVTPEDGPLALFGSEVSTEVADLLGAAGIELHTGTYAEVESPGKLWLRPSGRSLEVERTVALPVLEGPAPVGLSCDERGFIPTDERARVRGAADVYAAGDGTTFPIKQGGVATQMADIAAAEIARRAGVNVEASDFRPVMRGVLLTGRGRHFMKADPTGGRGPASTFSEQALWWPPGKIAGAYLAPYLAGPDPGPPPDREGREIELALDAPLHVGPVGGSGE